MARVSLVLFLVASLLTQLGCGATLPDSRIIGGEVAEEGEFPWQVSLRFNHQLLCGGTLVSVQHVLTAAHCIAGLDSSTILTASMIYVVTGTNSLASGGENHAVKTIYIHPSYVGVSTSYANDVAVLTLESAITETSLQSPIALATEDTPVGAKVVVSGWGRVVYPSTSLPTALQKMNSTTINTTTCQASWDLDIYDSQLCAVQNVGIGTCPGDSGGPLVYNNQVAGIVSYGNHCAHGIPEVYTRVYYYLSWIGNIVYNTEAREDTLDIKDADSV